jgi:hypothetical protein
VKDAGEDRYVNLDMGCNFSRFLVSVDILMFKFVSVHVSGIRGSPPPSTTKFAVFYQGGYEAQILLNATGYATTRKWDLIEKQIRHFLPDEAKKELETLEFQR